MTDICTALSNMGGSQNARVQGEALGRQAETNVRHKDDRHHFTSTSMAATLSSVEATTCPFPPASRDNFPLKTKPLQFINMGPDLF